MKLCRSCKKEIDSKASKCPFCQTKQGNWAQRHPVLTGIIVLFVIGMIASSSGSKPKTNEPIAQKVESGSPTATPAPVKTEFKVGETVEMKDYQLTINKVTKAPSKGYSTPKKGNEYVFVNLTIKNKGDKEVSYNPYDFKIQDSDGNQTTNTYVSLDDQLNSGSLAAGGKVTGTLSFEAPKGDKQLQLIYQPNFWLDNQRITIQLQ